MPSGSGSSPSDTGGAHDPGARAQSAPDAFETRPRSEGHAGLSRGRRALQELASRLVNKRWLDKLLCYSEQSIDGSEVDLKSSSSQEDLPVA